MHPSFYDKDLNQHLISMFVGGKWLSIIIEYYIKGKYNDSTLYFYLWEERTPTMKMESCILNPEEYM